MAWKVERAPDDSVVAVFEGHLDAESGKASARAFGEAISKGPVNVVWDLRTMSGYDAGAREAWQDAIWPNRKNIRSLTVIGAKPLVRVGAVMLAVFIGAPWKSLDAPPPQPKPKGNRDSPHP